MVRRILCPVDCSEGSCHAVEHATAIAAWYGASLTALHVYRPVFMPVPGLPPPEDRVSDEELGRVRTEVSAWLARACAGRADVLVEVGHPARQILDRAMAWDADLIVMGTHGAGGFEHMVLGSVTETVLRQATCPVLTVPPRAQASSVLPFRRLLCAVDFSESSAAAVELAASLATRSWSALTLLHVIEWPWDEPPPPNLQELPPTQAGALAEYRRHLEKTAMERLRALTPTGTGLGGVQSRIVHGKAYTEILRAAAEMPADLIVMGIQGRNSADLMLFGSTTNQVVRRACCPVLTWRR